MRKWMLFLMFSLCLTLGCSLEAVGAAETLPSVWFTVPESYGETIDLTTRNGDVVIKESKVYLIKGSDDETWVFTHKIKVDKESASPHIFFDGVNIQPSSGGAVEINSKSTACLYFVGHDSKLTGAKSSAAIQKSETAGFLRVLVEKDVKVECIGGENAAGIGGKEGKYTWPDERSSCENLWFGSQEATLWSGEIVAQGGFNGAGIGGGKDCGVKQLHFYSGTVSATGGHMGAGIGVACV